MTPRQSEALDLIADGRFVPDLVREDDGWHARWRALDGGENIWLDGYIREAAMTALTEDAENDRHETLHDAWLAALTSRTGLVRWDDGQCEAFARDLESWRGDDGGSEARRMICFRFSDLEIHTAVPAGRAALRALGEATYVFGPLREMKKSGDELVVKLRHTEAESFIRSGARELINAGYRVEGCRLAAEITAGVDFDDADGRASDRVAVRKVTIHVAGEEVSEQEIRFLLDQGSSLVFFRDRWIEVDRNILRNALKVLERTSSRRLTRASALAFAFGIGYLGSLAVAEAKGHGWLRGLVASLRDRGERIGAEISTDGFRGTLRDYQRRGAEFLKFLTDNGFGALLADDMGLGKTVQTIAWALDFIRSHPGGSLLVVAPLTLLANWRRELAAFAPSLRVYIHQGHDRRFVSGFRRAVAESDVVVTSYTLLVRDYREFSSVEWNAVVVDEAQAMKNPATRLANALKSLGAVRRIALTGTPVENSLDDIWSIEEFLNPGFLGERRTFAELGVKRIRHALEPFVMRRLKTDKTIAGEIGDRREIREYCALSPVQRAEYERALADYRSGERQQGDIFALITELKLICDGEGKFARLYELLESIFDAGESALVFSQYAKVGAALQKRIAERFGMMVPFLHGALSPAAREKAIADFNRRGPKAFVLSLKAGGFGLNLIKATHVIHFDRWWNPAVENQATDRAHRIGQRHTVFSHLFITEGTLEEHVDEILNRKRDLADSVITEAEWLEAVKLK